MTMLETIKFEKLKKKFALNNSYFKNRQHNAPSNPFEVLEYYKLKPIKSQICFKITAFMRML